MVLEAEAEAAILAAVMHRVAVIVEATGAEDEGTLHTRTGSRDHVDAMCCLLILGLFHLSGFAVVGKARKSLLGL